MHTTPAEYSGMSHLHRLYLLGIEGALPLWEEPSTLLYLVAARVSRRVMYGGLQDYIEVWKPLYSVPLV